jgi:cytosine/adenosine deaminase-related metal-dependent hydrolase
MNMLINGIIRSLMVFLTTLSFNIQAQKVEVLLADSIITNAKIYTMDNKDILSSDPGSIVQAMAIREGKILAIGSNNEMLQLIKIGTRVIDVQGKTIIPGLIETHVHPESTMNGVELYSDERDAYSWAGVKVVGEEGHELTPSIYFRDLSMFTTRQIKNPVRKAQQVK